MNSLTRRTLLGLAAGSLSPMAGWQGLRDDYRHRSVDELVSRRLLSLSSSREARRLALSPVDRDIGEAHSLRAVHLTDAPKNALARSAEGESVATTVSGASFLAEDAAGGAWHSTFIDEFLPPGSYLYADAVPFPTRLSHPNGETLEVRVNNQPVPLHVGVSGEQGETQINHLAPYGAAPGSAVEIIFGARRAYGSVDIHGERTALFVRLGTAAGFQADDAIYELGGPPIIVPTGEADLESYFSFFLSGADLDALAGRPVLGDLNPAEAVSLPTPRVFIDGEQLPQEHLLYFGLAPSLAGVQQGNIKVPHWIEPGLRYLVLERSDGTRSQPAALPLSKTGAYVHGTMATVVNVPDEARVENDGRLRVAELGSDTALQIYGAEEQLIVDVHLSDSPYMVDLPDPGSVPSRVRLEREGALPVVIDNPFKEVQS